MAQTYGYDPDREVEELYAAITGRPAFSYTPGSDPLYRSYAERYIQNGRLAMRDTQGRAAALTGGYGSSYAQGVGQQRYDEYLRALSEALPALYDRAWQRYSAEGEALQDAYDRSWARREDAYQRGRDAEEDAYRRERDALADQRYEAGQRAQAEKLAYTQQQESYTRLYKLIASTGYTPTDAELEAAGLSRAQAEALAYEYRRANGLLDPAPVASSGGGYRRSRKKKTKTKSTAKSGAASASAGGSLNALTVGSLAGLGRYPGNGGR